MHAHKLNPIDLLGLNVAFEEILQSMDESEGKRKISIILLRA
jgi:hypothetical protein